jgi:hypothetical protein
MFAMPNAQLARLRLYCLLAASALGGLPLSAQVSQSLGNLAPGQSVTISYEVVIDSPVAHGTTQVSSQGSVSGSNFTTVLTDDPETAAAADPTVTDISNEAPFAGSDTIERPANGDVKVKVSELLANDSDPDGDSLTFAGVVSPSPGGATVSVADGWVYYDHSGSRADTFTYFITDNQGNTSNGTVQVNIQGADAQFTTRLGITYDGSGAHITFDGIPGRTYIVQYQNAIGGGPWQDLGSATDAGLGRFSFHDPAGSNNRFYRSVYR